MSQKILLPCSLFFAVIFSACASVPTPTPLPTATFAPKVTLTPTLTPTPQPTATFTPIATLVPTFTPTATPTLTPTRTPEPTFTRKPSPTPAPMVFDIPVYGFTPDEIKQIHDSLAVLKACRPDIFEFTINNIAGAQNASITDTGFRRVVNLSISQLNSLGATIAEALVHEARHLASCEYNERCANEWHDQVSACFR
jgi:hypothetical protein